MAVQEDSFHIQRKVTFFLEAFEIFRNTERVVVVRGGKCGGAVQSAVSVWRCRAGQDPFDKHCRKSP